MIYLKAFPFLGVSFLTALFVFGVATLLIKLLKENPLFAGYFTWVYKVAETKPNLAKALGLCDFCFTHWLGYLLTIPFAFYFTDGLPLFIAFYLLTIIYITSIYNLCRL